MTFFIGQILYYGAAGLCRVEGFGPSPISGDQRTYCTLRPLSEGNGRIFFPKDEPKVTVRKTMTGEEVTALQKEFLSLPPLPELKDRQKRELFREMVFSADPRRIAELWHGILLHKEDCQKNGKRLPETEVRYEATAKHLLLSEAAYILKITEDEAEELFLSGGNRLS